MTDIMSFLLHLTHLYLLLFGYVSICEDMHCKVTTAVNLQTKVTQESFQQPLLFDLHADALALHCCRSPEIDLLSSVLYGTLILNLTVSCMQAQLFLQLK
jgi:hypothetical protein